MAGRLKVIRLRFTRLWKVILLVATAATAGGVFCERNDWLNLGDAEMGAYDQGLKFFTYGDLKRLVHPKPPPASKDIVLVAIDDRTFDGVRHNPSYALTFGTWPYSRNVWARVLEHLTKEQARAVVFDMVMDERHTDASGDLALAEALRQTRIPFYLGFSVSASKVEHTEQRRLPKVTPENRLAPGTKAATQQGPAAPDAHGAETSNAQRPLAETSTAQKPGAEASSARRPAAAGPKPTGGAPEKRAAEKTPAAKEVLPDESSGGFDDVPSDPEPAPEQIAQALAFPVKAEGVGLVTLEDQGQPQLPNRPISPLLDVVSGFGLVKHEEDGDGKIRRTRFAYTDGANTYVTLATAVAADLFGAKGVTIRPDSLLLGDRRFAINSDGSAEIAYGGRLEDRFPQVSLLAVLDDWVLAQQGKETRLPKGYFENKVVIVAGFAAGTYDLKATPFSAGTPGVIKVAAELQNFLDGAFIISAPYWVSLLLSFLVALFSAAIILVVKSTWLEIGWPLVLFFGFFVVTGALLVGFDLHVLSALPMAAGEFASVSAVAVNHLFANKDREYLREAFSRYMERDLVEQMVEARELPKLTGENMEVTAFFSDIRGFSTFSEKLKADPKTLVRVMNL
ncbi:MAG: CHASE2 domain-containing protein, partial [Myxococcaceae bacterium]